MKARTYILDGREIPVVISEQAVQEWEAQRERLRASGYPDRPPDVDTPTTRSWVVHPGEPGWEEKEKSKGGTWPYETLVSHVPDQPSVKFLANRLETDPDNLYVRTRYENPDGTFDTVAEMLMPRKAWEKMKAEATAKVKEMGGEMLHTAPEDFESLSTEHNEVEQAIADWYTERAGAAMSGGIH